MNTKANTTKLFTLLVFLLLFKSANAQEMLGVTLGNYKGTAGLLVNPAGMTTNKLYLDINLATANFFASNNIVYIPKEDFPTFDIRNFGFPPIYGPDTNRNVDYYDNHNLKEGTVKARILGPSVMMQVGDHAFGITTGVRYFLSGNRIPWDLTEIGYKELHHKPLQNIEHDDNDFDFNTSAWMEVGLSYAYNVIKSFDEQLTVGVSIKKLWGYGGGYLKTNNVNYIAVDDSTINIKNLNAEAGFSLPIDYDNNDFISSTSTFRGSGMGVDIGAVFLKKKKMSYNEWDGKGLCSQKYDEYVYRIGVSILDIGRVKYTSNAQLHSYDDVSKYWSSVDTLNFSNVNEMMSEISNTFYGDPDASLISNTIKIGLPTALSVQVDFSLPNNIYIGGFWIHPIRLNMNTLRRPAQLAVVPRFETKYFEFSLPLSLYEYRYPRVGIAARFYFITIGTEKLGTYLGMSDINGLDIYASIKLSINKGSCRNRNGGACSNQNFGSKLQKRKKRR